MEPTVEATEVFNQKDLEMLWASCEEELFLFAENGHSDPRYKDRDWAALLSKIENALAELNAKVPRILKRG